MINKLMYSLGIKYYEYIPGRKTLIIYEPMPVKILVFIKSQLKDININIQGR